MAQATRPNVTINNNQRLYHSLDAVDQGVYNGLTTAKARKKFLEMITRWLDPVKEPSIKATPANGQAILDRWRSHGHRIRNVLDRPAPAVQAVPPPVVIPVAPPVHAGPLIVVPPASINPAGAISLTIAPTASPPQSPLAELSPKFANNNDTTVQKPLSPTYGQLRFIGGQFKAPWKIRKCAFSI